MTDAAPSGVPLHERAWSASAAVQPPANLGRPMETGSTSPATFDLQVKAQGEAAIVAPLRPAAIVVPSFDPCSPNGNRLPNSPSFAASSPLSVLSAAAASLKDKTHQVAQQQKRALSAFQQKGGLVSWLHGDESGEQTSPITPDALSFVENDQLCTPPSPHSPIGFPTTIVSVGRRRSLPNIGSNSLLDNIYDRVTGVSHSSSNSRDKSQPVKETVKPSTSSVDNGMRSTSPTSRSNTLSSPEIGRPRAATTDLPSRTNSRVDDLNSPVHYQARYLCPPRYSETRFSLDDVFSDEWSCTVLWAHLFSSAAGRDHQHHQRLSFLIETTFRITPLYRKLAGADDTLTDKENDFRKLIVCLKRLHSRFLMHSGTAAFAINGVPVASPAASHAKNHLAIAVHTLTDQQISSNSLTGDAQVEKAISALFQLAREVEREFRVLGTRSYGNFADSTIYRDFIAYKSGPSSIAALLRYARIPFYQQPSGFVDSVCLESLASGDAATAFSRAGCQAFIIAAQPNGSIKLTHISPSIDDESTTEQSHLVRTIEPFLNPSASVHLASSKPLAFNFITGSGVNMLYGAVVWLPVDQNNRLTAEGVPDGFCIVSKFPLADSMRCFLSSLWNGIRGDVEVNSPDALIVQVVDASLAMGQHLLTSQHEISLDSKQLPTIDFRLDDLFDCLSLTHVLRLFAFALLEKKIALVASSYTILFSVSEALRALLHPLIWSHVYVPVLPLALKDCLQCPTPFIFGLHDSYVRRCDMPRPSNDFVVVNLDRDSVTGGGDVILPPGRHCMMREELFHLIKPQLAFRDGVDIFSGDKSASKAFPTHAVRQVFRKHLREILASLEPCVNRFEFNDQYVSVVDNINANLWPRFTSN